MAQNNTEDYGWKGDESPHTHAYLSEPIKLALTNNQIDSVIDLGCGNGDMCKQISQVCNTVVGLEYDSQGCEIARASNPELKFYNMGLHDSSDQVLSAHGRFDAAVSTEVIEHLYSPHELPQFAASVLKPGGLLIVTTPYHGYLKNLVLAVLNKWDSHHDPLWHGGHIKFWSRPTLSKLLEENGFEILEHQGLGRLPWLWKSMLMVAKLRD